MKQLEVQIMGQSYLLGCPEGGEPQLLDAVSRVDKAMCKIRDAGKVKSRDRIAVLAALNLAFEMPDAVYSTSNNSPNPTEDDSQIQALIEKIDSALGNDGRLI